MLVAVTVAAADKGCHMQTTELPTHSHRWTVDDIDGDGGVDVSRTRDYVKVNCWGGHAGPNGCNTNLTPAGARALAVWLTVFADEAERYGDQWGVK